jgi:Protein of unknown function (DUF669)
VSSLNWSDLKRSASEAGFDVVPADEYDVYVESATAAKTANGKDMIKTRFRVETGPHAGKPVFNQFVISPDNANALAFFFRHMRVLGLDDAFFGASPSIEQVSSALVNKRCRVRVSVRQWNDQDRNQVDAVMPPANGMPATPTPPPSAAPLPPGGTAHFAPTAPPVTKAPPANVTPIKPKSEAAPPPPDLPF